MAWHDPTQQQHKLRTNEGKVFLPILWNKPQDISDIVVFEIRQKCLCRPGNTGETTSTTPDFAELYPMKDNVQTRVISQLGKSGGCPVTSYRARGTHPIDVCILEWYAPRIMQTYLRRPRENSLDGNVQPSAVTQTEYDSETMPQVNAMLAELWQATPPNRDTKTPERLDDNQGASQWRYSDRQNDALLRASWDVAIMTDANEQHQHGGDEVRVLVMDDSPVVRNLIVAMLEDIGSVDEVVQVADAPAAVEAVLDEPPRIAILDIKVPGNQSLRNGIDVLRAIKRSKPETEVIMLTNHAIPLYRQTCIDAGASYFFDKSSEFDQLPHAIEEILRK